jgi:hypothetical protein
MKPGALPPKMLQENPLDSLGEKPKNLGLFTKNWSAGSLFNTMK